MDEGVVLTIVGMSLLTYIPRLVPALLLSGRSLPRPVLGWLELLPPAILSALVAQAVLVRDGAVDVSVANPALAPAVVTAFVAWRTRHLAWTVTSGLIAAAVYNWLQ